MPEAAFTLRAPDSWRSPPSPVWIIRQQEAGVLCPRCTRILPRFRGQPLNIPFLRPVDATHLWEPTSLGVALVKRSVYELLAPHLAEHACFPPLDRSGAAIETHVIVHPSDAAVVDLRHYPPRGVEVCEGCGTIRIVYADNRPTYLLQRYFKRPSVFDRIGLPYFSAAGRLCGGPEWTCNRVLFGSRGAFRPSVTSKVHKGLDDRVTWARIGEVISEPAPALLTRTRVTSARRWDGSLPSMDLLETPQIAFSGRARIRAVLERLAAAGELKSELWLPVAEHVWGIRGGAAHVGMFRDGVDWVLTHWFINDGAKWPVAECELAKQIRYEHLNPRIPAKYALSV